MYLCGLSALAGPFSVDLTWNYPPIHRDWEENPDDELAHAADG